MSIFALGGATVLWRTWLVDHPTHKQWIQKTLQGFQKVLLCGSCFTYWLTLAFIILYNPLPNFSLSTRFDLGVITDVLNFLILWMSFAWGALMVRFTYVAIQEIVSYLVHKINGHSH